MFGVGILVALSLGLTLTTQAVRRLSEDASDEIGPLGAGADFFGWASGTAAPILLSFAVFTVAYTVIPSLRQPFRDIWPGALLAAFAFEGFKIGFSFYLANFASYNVVYGSLAAVIAFMVFVYLSSILLLVCAELVSELGIARIEAEQAKKPSTPVPLRDKTKRALQRLVVDSDAADPSRPGAGRRRGLRSRSRGRLVGALCRLARSASTHGSHRPLATETRRGSPHGLSFPHRNRTRRESL